MPASLSKHCVVLHLPKEKSIVVSSRTCRLPEGYYCAITPHTHIAGLSKHLHILFRRELAGIKKNEEHLHSSLARLSQRKVPGLKLYFFEQNPLFLKQFHAAIEEG